jgi:hypothetical protein
MAQGKYSADRNRTAQRTAEERRSARAGAAWRTGHHVGRPARAQLDRAVRAGSQGAPDRSCPRRAREVSPEPRAQGASPANGKCSAGAALGVLTSCRSKTH